MIGPGDSHPPRGSLLAFSWKRWLPYLLFAAITLAVFWKFLLYGHSLYALSILENQLGRPAQEPPRWFAAERPHVSVADNIVLLPSLLRIYNEGLKAGELRLWNPTLVCGYPVYADPMVHPFYPPHLVLHRFLAPHTAYELGLLLHLFFSGTAMFWLLRALGRSAAAAAAGGVVWMLFGYNSIWFSTCVLEGVSVFGPLALLAIFRGLDRRDMGHAAFAALAMGMAILGSHPQHALNLFLFFLMWLLVSGLRAREGRMFVVRFSTLFALLSVGVGLAAILTRLDSMGNGWRNPGADLGTLYEKPLTLMSHLLGLVLGKVYFPEEGPVEYEFTIYAGLAASTLAISGATRFFRDPWVRFVALFGVSALLVAFLLPFAIVFQHIPILNLSPSSRWVFVAGFCLAILAGYGFDALDARVGRVPVILAAVTGTFVLATALGLSAYRIKSGATIDTAIGFSLATAAAFVANRWERAALPLAFGALLYELLIPFVLAHWHVDPAALRETPEAIRFVQERERGNGPWRGTGLLGSDSPGGEIDDSEMRIGGNLMAIYGVENVGGWEAIIPANYYEYGRSAGGVYTASGRGIHFPTFGSKLLDAAGLKYLFLPPAVMPPPRFRPLKEFHRIKVYENAQALPRGYLVGRVLTAKNEDQAKRLLSSPRFNPRDTTILETDDPLPPLGEVHGGRVEWVERLPHRLALRVTAREPAILVLSDTDYPGWEAEVDGQPVPIYRANLAFRAVAVPPGEHVFRFAFRPDCVRTGLIMSVLFLLAGIGYAAGRRYHGRARPPA